jgi:hypothetical protein
MKKLVMIGVVSIILGVVVGVFTTIGVGAIVAIAVFSLISMFMRERPEVAKQDQILVEGNEDFILN